MPWNLRNPEAADIAPDWLKPHCKPFLQALADQGHAHVAIRTYDRAAALFCHEVSRRGLRRGQLTGATLTKVRASALGRMHPTKHDQKKYSLDRFIDANRNVTRARRIAVSLSVSPSFRWQTKQARVRLK